jgi:hypothetical protein
LASSFWYRSGRESWLIRSSIEYAWTVLFYCFLAANDRHSGISLVRLKDSTATLRDESADYSKAKEFNKDDILAAGHTWSVGETK